MEEGKIGEIRHIRMRNATKNPFDSAPGYGGCMMDIGCHGMDLIHTVRGPPLKRCSRCTCPRGTKSAERNSASVPT